jgi:hypothetical protein
MFMNFGGSRIDRKLSLFKDENQDVGKGGGSATANVKSSVESYWLDDASFTEAQCL